MDKQLTKISMWDLLWKQTRITFQHYLQYQCSKTRTLTFNSMMDLILLKKICYLLITIIRRCQSRHTRHNPNLLRKLVEWGWWILLMYSLLSAVNMLKQWALRKESWEDQLENWDLLNMIHIVDSICKALGRESLLHCKTDFLKLSLISDRQDTEIKLMRL